MPEQQEDAVTLLEPGVDVPDRLNDQPSWLAAVGFELTVEWSWKDLAVVGASTGRVRRPAGEARPA